MKRSSLTDIKKQQPRLPPLSSPPPPPPHLCNNIETPSTPIPSRLERLQRKASEKWFNPLRLSSKRSSQQYLRHKQSTLTLSPYSNDKRNDILSPTPSSSSHLPHNKRHSRTEEIKRSRSFAYGHQSSTSPTATITNANIAYTKATMIPPTPTLSPSDIYPALLSRVAYELQQNMTLMDHFKNGIEYKNCFTGHDAVDHLVRIVCTNDRFLALMVGRALGSQRFFHDVGYEHRLLDSVEELYHFEESNFVNKSNNNINTLSSNNYPDDLLLHYCDSPTTISHGTATASNSSINNLYTPHPGDDIPSSKQPTAPFPNGVMTDLTYCYSSTCHGNSPCYSYSCPKRRSVKRPDHYYQVLHSQEHPLWADLVSESEYNTISKQERKRQEGIYELIYTETNYVKDLEYLEEMWVQPLTKTDILPESRRDTFMNTVFSNLSSIYAINVRLASALLARQKERLVVYAIGDIMLDFVVDFEPYIKYCYRQFEAKFALERERYFNPAFDWFINDTERHPVSHKLELNGYLTKPTTRMGKYLLLLDEILKRTPPGHPDYDDIPKATAIIKQFLTRVNTQAGDAKNRFDLEQMHNNLVFKHKADTMDLGLLKDTRVIIKQGVLRKTPSEDSTEYQVILLDHYLVVAKVKMGPGGELKYVVQKRPMSLDLLKVFVPTTENRNDMDIINNSDSNPLTPANISNINDSSDRDSTNDGHTSNGGDLRQKKRPSSILPYVNITNANSPMTLRPFNDSCQQPNNSSNGDKFPPSSAPTTTILNDRERKIGYPIVFDYLGRRNQSEALILYATSNAIRKPWIDKIIKQQKERQRRNKLIFEIVPAVEPGHFVSHTQVNHIVTFNSGQQYILAADDGVYVGHTSGKKTPNKVLSIQKVTQVQVVESAQMLLVLSDRTLWEYGLDVVNGKPESQPLGRRVQSHVPFFHVGRSLQSTLVCVPRVSTLKSTITTFEPITNGIINTTGSDKNGGGGGGGIGGGGNIRHKNDLKAAAGGVGGSVIDNGGIGGNSSSKSGNRNGNSSEKHIAFSKRNHTGNEGVASRISAEYGRRKSMGLLDRMSLLHVGSQNHHEQSDLRLERLKLSYVPCEVWSIELSPSKMLITSPRGMIMLDMKTDKPQQLLDPDDKRLKFITDREESSHIRQPLKHIAIFRTPRGDHFVCYDEYGFYIDGKGNRLYPNFLVEWEGSPEAFAYQYPYIIAFERSFIEVRHIITGELEQIICGSNIRCLNNGHKTEKPLIFGVMWDKQRKQASIFELKGTSVDQSSSSS